MKLLKKTLSLILVFSMLVSVLPFAAFADEGEEIAAVETAEPAPVEEKEEKKEKKEEPKQEEPTEESLPDIIDDETDPSSDVEKQTEGSAEREGESVNAEGDDAGEIPEEAVEELLDEGQQIGAETFLELLSSEERQEGGFVLIEDVTLTAETVAELPFMLRVPEGIMLTVGGSLTVLAEVTVNGTLCVAEGGVLTVAEGATLTFEGEESELTNLGTIDVYGSVTLSEQTVFADTNLPLRLFGTGSVMGTEQIVFVDAAEETAMLTAEEFAGLIASGGLGDGCDYILTEDAEIPINSMLALLSGSLTVPDGITLTNRGLLSVNGGEMTVDGTLSNGFFIHVSGAGVLTVNGAYETGERGVLEWDRTEGDALVSGIQMGLIDCTVMAADAEELRQTLKTHGYRTLTVCIPKAAFAEGVKIPDGVAVSVR